MAEPVLWDLELHTAAKHRVLRAYLDAWVPVMAQQALKMRHQTVGEPRLLLVDGFAGPGRYETGEPGSPLIMVDAVLSHSGFVRLSDVQFIFLFIEHDRRRIDRLRQEVAGLGTLPANVAVHIEPGEFETTFGAVIDGATGPGRRHEKIAVSPFESPRVGGDDRRKGRGEALVHREAAARTAGGPMNGVRSRG